MEKNSPAQNKIKNAIYTIVYLLLGSSSFIAAGMFLSKAIAASNKDHIFRALLFCGLGLFWIYMFGEKRRQGVFEEDKQEFFFGMDKLDDEELE